MLQSDPAEATWDVVVVGCGPVGALAANLLGKAQIRTLVLEREADPYPLPRAVHLDHEMMRLFGAAGVLERVQNLMFATDGHIHIGADGGVIRYLGTAGKQTPFTFSNDYFFYQPELEATLRESVADYPHVEVRLDCRVTGISQDPDGVQLTVQHGDRSYPVRSRYAVACDGARSSVRKALGIGLADLDFEEPWLVVDAEVDGPISFPAFDHVPAEADLQRLSVMLCDPRRPATIVPGRGNHRRWEFMLLPGESDEEMMQPERVAALVEPWVQGVPHRIVRAATYRFHGLVAEQWQLGRVFLAGDAAHQTPPFFGQGMCHGFRDVANLTWKLELVLDGTSAPRLLDTYQPERDPHVRAVISAAVEAGRYICQLDPDLAAERDRRLRQAMFSGPSTTAADLIPPIRSGVVYEEGISVRFIQPRVARPGGAACRLDEITRGGWILIAKPELALTQHAQQLWTKIGGKSFVLGEDLIDTDGHLTEWLRKHHSAAVVVRPDFYAYGTASDSASLTKVIEKLASDLALLQLAGVPA